MIPNYWSATWTAKAPALGNCVWKLLQFAAAAGAVAFSLGIVWPTCAQTPPTTSAPLPSFEVASIKPNRSGDLNRRIMFQFLPGRLNATGITVKLLISMAYDVKEFQVSGGPGWIDSQRFDIDAKEEDSQAEEEHKLPPEKIREHNQLMMQSLLADRFKLKVSHQTKELPVYALVVAKNGPKLKEAKPGDTYPNGIKGPDGVAHGGLFMMRAGGGEMTGLGIPLANLVMMLSQQLGRNVLDQTGLKGNYDIHLKWTPDEPQTAMFSGPAGAKPPGDNPAPPDSSGPSIFTALQEQLGLKLDSTKGPVEILVVDHIEQPSEN